MTDGTRLIIESVVVTIALSVFGAWALYSFLMARRQSPDLARKQYQMAVDLSNRVSVLERERERDYLERQAERQRDHAIMAKLQRRVADLEHGVERLGAQIVRLGGVPEWELPPAEPLPPIPSPSEVIDDTALYRSIATLFDVDELDDLAFRLGIEPDEIEGKRRDTKARSLIQHCKRRDLLPELIDIARQLRPEGRF